MKTKLCVLALAVTACLPAPAALYDETYTGPFTDNGGAGAGVIPNNSPIGLTSAEILSGLPDSVITDVTLSLTLEGRYISDLTGYLRLGDLSTSSSYSLNSALSANETVFTVDVSSAFTSQNPNDTWTLFLADNQVGGQSELVSWELNITAIPEPANAALGIFGAVGLGAIVFRGARKVFVRESSLNHPR